MNKSLKIVFFGSPYFISPVLDSLKQNFNVVKAIDSKTPVEDLNKLKELNPDLFVVAAYGRIIPQEVLDIPKFGSINIHPSLLPKYRGACPIQAAIINGDKSTGVSYILMDDKMDHGPIISQSSPIFIDSQDTFETLAVNIFRDTVGTSITHIINDFVDKKITPISQDDTQSTYTWRTAQTKEQAFIDLENLPDIITLDRKIRAFHPEPGAWTTWKDKHIKFLPKGFVQMEGKRVVKLKDFLNGYPDFPIKQLLEG